MGYVLKNPFFRYLKKHIKSFIIALPFSIFVSSTSGSLALLVKFATDFGIQQKDMKVIVLTAFAVVFIFALRGIGKVFSVKLVRQASEGLTNDIRRDVFERIQKVPLDRIMSSPETISKLVADTIIIGQIDEVIRSFLKDPPALLFLVGVAVWLSPNLALSSLIAFLFLAVVIRRISQAIKKASEEARKNADEIARKIQDALQGAKVVRIYSLESLIPQFERISQEYARNMVKSEVLRASSSAVAEVSGALVVAILLVISGKAMVEGKMTLGSFLAFTGAVAGMWEPIKFISNAVSKLNQILPSIKRISEITQFETMKDGKVEKETFEDSITFENVSFWYDGQLERPNSQVQKTTNFKSKAVLDGINLVIRKGEKICIRGKSGVGKTTLVSLIPRFFDVKKGAVKIDGVDVRDIKVESLRKLVAFVEQEPYIFDGTVFENVAVAKRGATRKEVERALKRAQFPLEKIPLDFVCGERGKNLSVGQKHRIAIARAILKNSPIIILDEPTANLDEKTEEELLSAFQNLTEGKTVILIAHKGKILQLAQKNYILENGKIKED